MLHLIVKCYQNYSLKKECGRNKYRIKYFMCETYIRKYLSLTLIKIFIFPIVNINISLYTSPKYVFYFIINKV